jgi:hypothetical protein
MQNSQLLNVKIPAALNLKFQNSFFTRKFLTERKKSKCFIESVIFKLKIIVIKQVQAVITFWIKRTTVQIKINRNQQSVTDLQKSAAENLTFFCYT